MCTPINCEAPSHHQNQNITENHFLPQQTSHQSEQTIRDRFLLTISSSVLSTIQSPEGQRIEASALSHRTDLEGDTERNELDLAIKSGVAPFPNKNIRQASGFPLAAMGYKGSACSESTAEASTVPAEVGIWRRGEPVAPGSHVAASPLLQVASPHSEDVSNCDGGDTVCTDDMTYTISVAGMQSQDDDSTIDETQNSTFENSRKPLSLERVASDVGTSDGRTDVSRQNQKTLGVLFSERHGETTPVTALLPSKSQQLESHRRTQSWGDVCTLNSRGTEIMHALPQSDNSDPFSESLSVGVNESRTSILGLQIHRFDDHQLDRALPTSKPQRPHSWYSAPYGRKGLSFSDDNGVLSPSSSSSAPIHVMPCDGANADERWGVSHAKKTAISPYTAHSISVHSPISSHSVYSHQQHIPHEFRPFEAYNLRPSVSDGYTRYDQPCGTQILSAAYLNHSVVTPLGSTMSPTARHQHQNYSPPSSVGGTIPLSSRSSSEVLKTLLRKKACLYEPGTSRAIALITWLVGRHLAITNGYFSRHHLQSGVHKVVAENIEAGVITRTKVNRCMQIILNSCFHYIISRPDGSEEKGDSFRKVFAEKAIDGLHLMKSLSPPWHELEINFDVVAILDVQCDQSDEEDESQANKKQFKRESNESEGASKRSVLLCFNENVRSAEDVLRCHNEFIRDTANAANLLLAADEWRSFFSGDDHDVSHVIGGTADSSASGGEALMLYSRAMDCKAIPYISFETSTEDSDFVAFRHKAPEPWSTNVDALGEMNASELFRFRSSWCSKRYEHNHRLCGFAHVDVNKSWLRRNPVLYDYSDEMCPHIVYVNNEKNSLYGLYINACPKGVACSLAHSREEIYYHPKRYKQTTCSSFTARNTFFSCEMKDVCPFSHPVNHRSTSPGYRAQHPRHLSKHRGDNPSSSKGVLAVGNRSSIPSGSTANIPYGTPMLYISPSPESEFDKALVLPGLQGIFRRHCSTLFAYSCGCSQSECQYRHFGDDWGLFFKDGGQGYSSVVISS